MIVFLFSNYFRSQWYKELTFLKLIQLKPFKFLSSCLSLTCQFLKLFINQSKSCNESLINQACSIPATPCHLGMGCVFIDLAAHKYVKTLSRYSPTTTLPLVNSITVKCSSYSGNVKTFLTLEPFFTASCQCTLLFQRNK